MTSKPAFTLGEVLVVLALLGVVAAFAVPKVLQASSSEQYNTIAKEAVAMLSDAMAFYKQSHGGTLLPTTKVSDIFALTNYLGPDTTSIVDMIPNNPFNSATTATCGSGVDCYKLLNGAVVYTNKGEYLGPLVPHSGFGFFIDPTGKVDSIQAVEVVIYASGLIRSDGTAFTDTQFCDAGLCPETGFTFLGNAVPQSKVDPPWFHWN